VNIKVGNLNRIGPTGKEEIAEVEELGMKNENYIMLAELEKKRRAILEEGRINKKRLVQGINLPRKRKKKNRNRRNLGLLSTP